MKRLSCLLLAIIAIAVISCRKDEIRTFKKTGTLLLDIGLTIHENKLNNGLKMAPQKEDFKVIVYSADGSEVMVFDSASVMPDSIELEPGNYFVEAHSDNNLPAEFENPYYNGASEIFTINSNTVQTVHINCGLANTIVSVIYSDTLKNSFIDYMTTASTALGSLVFTKTETRQGYFQTLPLNIFVELTYLNPDGSQGFKTLSGNISDPQAGRHYEISVNATKDIGMGIFQILLDETAIPVEVIEINDDSLIPVSNTLKYGDILISEIMFDPTALSDTEGEWIEIYNNSGHAVSLGNLILKRDSTNSHTITAPNELSAGQFFVLERTELATDTTDRYIYGSGISLPNTGAILSIYNKASEADPGILIFAVNYGDDGFPSPAGASIILNPDKFNAADAISASSWCTSGSVYYTGDLGTPGKANDPCH